MLVSLHVKNLALIQETEVFFGPHLNILTGETGAGKSIIIGSVGLALGGRGDRDLIRTGADYALIELVFQLEKEGQIEKVKKLDIPIEEDGLVILQRRIMPQRSISKVNGETVNARLLKELSGVLIDIHGQHDSQQLLQTKKHLEILDDFAGEEFSRIKREIKEKYQFYRKIQEKLAETDLDEREKERQLSLARFEVEEIENASLKAGEDEELEKQYQKMSNSRKIAENLGNVHILTGYDQEGSAGEAVGRALRELNSVSAYDSVLDEMAVMLTDIDGLLNDFNRSVSDYLSDLEFDQNDFLQVEERLNTINRLKDKYGSTIEEILLYKENREEELQRLIDADAYRDKLNAQLRDARGALELVCTCATEIRKKAGKKLAKLFIEALQDLNFNQVDFAVEVERKDSIGPDGWDEVSFMISTNPGEPRRPLANVASGGELSRIMLALKTITAGQEDKDTFIFDEIDTGISGKTAWKVSRKLAVLGKSRQVICITHLPQIAAMADNHFIIEKKSMEDSTSTAIMEIGGTDILNELARMLGSDTITENSLANARELKEMAANTKQY
ncbi:DNA replication and repair protein RecN [Lachnospiraceae bacterium NLAE-zl-G231]|nr:DNA replication and repair protein RecN [Lachnospiraceae bacterium NLAE-zl-G231]